MDCLFIKDLVFKQALKPIEIIMKKTSAIIMLVTLAAAATSCSVLNPSKKSVANTTSGAQATKIESTSRPGMTTETKKPVSQAAEAVNPEAVKQSVPAPAVSKKIGRAHV